MDGTPRTPRRHPARTSSSSSNKRKTREGRAINSRTRYYWLAHLHAFYKWAVNEELTEKDPTLAIIRPKQRRTLPRPIEDEDLVMAIRAATPQMRAMLSLAAYPA